MLLAAGGEAGEEPCECTGDVVVAGDVHVVFDRFVGSICCSASVFCGGVRGRVSANNEATLKLLKRELVLCNCC